MSPKLPARVCKHELFSKTYIGQAAGSAIRTYEGSNEHTSKQAALKGRLPMSRRGAAITLEARAAPNTTQHHDVAWSWSVLRSRSGLPKVYAM
jgi:hypothetical protein